MKIVAVVVLYKCKPATSLTVRTLINNYQHDPLSFLNVHLVIYDNGPEFTGEKFVLPFDHNYVTDTSNRGLAVAYNHALTVANNRSAQWLLLLDQDSDLPVAFMNDLQGSIRQNETDADVAVFVPRMHYHGEYFSPSRVLYGGIHRPVGKEVTGFFPGEIFAVGSATTVRCSFINNLGGFNELFWLDCLDRWLYLMIYRQNKKAFIIQSIIEHNLSVLDYDTGINEKRYRNIVVAETKFMHLYKSGGENLVYLFRLLKRIIFFSVNKRKWKYSRITLGCLPLLWKK